MTGALDFDRAGSAFQPTGLVGFERVAIDAPVRDAQLDHAPVWTEPAPPQHLGHGPNYANVAGGLVIALALGCGGGLAALAGIAFGGLVLLASIASTAVAIAVLAARESRRRTELSGWLATERAKFAAAQDIRMRRVREHEMRESERVVNAPIWYPIAPRGGFRGLDVFGGGTDGWRCLLATVGTSLLRSGAPITVLDFTERELADGLGAFAAQLGHPVVRVDLPRECGPLDLFGPLAVDELAEVVAESIAAARRTHPDVGTLRRRAVELVKAVAGQLDPDLPVTFGRLAAGLSILRRIAHEDPRISAAEAGRLSGIIDIVGTGDRIREEMEYLTSLFELLADGAPESLAEPPRWPTAGLLVLSTMSTLDERKTMTDQFVFHRVLHDLRRSAGATGEQVLILALPDHFDAASVSALARHADRNGVRVILLAPHLRDEMGQLLGSSGNPTVLMRLNNAEGAKAAAEFVGRGHKFVRSQLTRQDGSTFTHGWGTALNTQTSTTDSSGTSEGREGSTSYSQASGSPATYGHSRGRSRGTNESTSWSRAHSFTDSVNDSIAESRSTGETDARVYEYLIEPTTVQGLEPTEFILVDSGRSRRVAFGDCNPRFAFMARVARQPRRM
ncbi:hypothetical protein [Nocardia goodfellowii]|uniref:TraD/TraG TraM recognition site domain-containing protein n=1 Tax=Nocardia goodfellowii TaxID=882446 RepID=A0ABS4QI46_9NOCA|nr:hypothetical protein [Nocardia goodfellowii]MBP2191361.1 hypothetical protein [Nocardia goodfellowii]